MTLYVDIIMCENLLMNYIILFTTGIVLKKKMKFYRILIASILGSLYAIVLYIKIESISSNIIMKIILSILMVWISFKSYYKKILKDLLMFYFISFIFGGCTFALMYLISPEKVTIYNGVLVGLYPIKVTIVSGIIAFIIIQIAFKITKNKLDTKDMICTIKLYEKNKMIKVKGFIDTGNMLKDPITNSSIIIIEKNKVKPLINNNIENMIQIIKGGESLDKNVKTDIRLIPYSSLGNKNGILIGIRIDKAIIEYNNSKVEIDKAIIGIYENKLTKDNRYQALIGLEILEGSK